MPWLLHMRKWPKLLTDNRADLARLLGMELQSKKERLSVFALIFCPWDENRAA